MKHLSGNERATPASWLRLTIAGLVGLIAGGLITAGLYTQELGTQGEKAALAIADFTQRDLAAIDAGEYARLHERLQQRYVGTVLLLAESGADRSRLEPLLAHVRARPNEYCRKALYIDPAKCLDLLEARSSRGGGD